MKKRLLACLLILSLFVTGLGFVPAVQAAEDGISAQWTTKENLAPADQEVLLRPEKGDLSAPWKSLARATSIRTATWSLSL